MSYVKIRRKDLKLTTQLGTGGFSVVYKAKLKKGIWTKQDVAAKRLNEANPHEAEILSQLDHPNTVKLLGVVDEQFEFFLILELCEGGSLRSYLNAHKGEWLGMRFYDWAKQAARPIKYLREKQITHKDIKSPNYLLTPDGIFKLTDFGLARSVEVTMSRATETASYAWMAPELLADNILSPIYDIYAFGVVVWELWSTEIPFEDAKVPANLLWRICNNNERPPIPADCPKVISDLLRHCWQIDWTKRPTIDHVLVVVSLTVIFLTIFCFFCCCFCIFLKSKQHRAFKSSYPFTLLIGWH